MTASKLPMPRLLLTVEEAAELLGVGRSTMYGLILDGAVESVQIGRLRRVPADAVPKFLDELRATAGIRHGELHVAEG